MGVKSRAHSAGVDFFEAGEAFGAVEIAVLPGDVRGYVERAGGCAFVDQINFGELCFKMTEHNLDVGFAGGRRGGFGVTIGEPINQGGYNNRIEDKKAEEDFFGAWGQVEITGRRIF